MNSQFFQKEAELFALINYRRSPEAQTRFNLLVKRRQNYKITPEELAELRTMTDESEMKGAERIRAVTELAEIRGLSFVEMWKEIEL